MGGLAAAVACTRAGWQAKVYEQARSFSEVGAGIQLGPNTTRILAGWGLEKALLEVAARPQRLRVRSAYNGWELGRMDLGAGFARRYGAPYVTLHRADLHAVLETGANRSGVAPELSSRVHGVTPGPSSVRGGFADGR